jgi:hypothetical protein
MIMAKHVLVQYMRHVFRWISIGLSILVFLVLLSTGQTQTPSVFASPQSTPVPTPQFRGIHMGNHANREDWGYDLLYRIDPAKGGTWPDIIVVLSWQVYDRHRSGPNCRIDSAAILTSTHASILDYLQRASSAGKRIIIRVMPSPGDFDANHHLLTTSSSGCNEGANRSYDDIGDEIIKIHEWNASHGITEFGFEPASEPNIEWYSLSTQPPISDQVVWVEMDAYFSAIYDYVHARYPSPTIRVLTPPMAQGAFAELYNVNGCGPMGLNDGKSGYEKMANIFLNGTKNDGYNWHNYWKVGYEDWANCDDAATHHGQHVSYWFPPAMWASMVVKPRSITEADLDSPPSIKPDHFGNLPDKDASFGITATNSLNKFINAEQWAERIAVWTLNVTDSDPQTGPEQNWHEAYRCNDIGQDGLILSERPWFMRWWSGIPAGFSFTPCYRVFLPVGSNNYTTELIKNGNFDAGGAYWTTTTSQPSCTYPVIIGVISDTTGTANTNAADLGRCNYNTDTLSQLIAIPGDVTSATLTYNYRVEHPYNEFSYQDHLYVQLHDYTTGELVTLTDRCMIC